VFSGNPVSLSCMLSNLLNKVVIVIVDRTLFVNMAIFVEMKAICAIFSVNQACGDVTDDVVM